MNLTIENSILLVIDVQEKLMEKISNREEVIANTCKAIDVFKTLGMPATWTEQYPKGLGPTIPEIARRLYEFPRAEKLSFDCFGSPSFVESMRSAGRPNIIVAGVEAHICVMQTVKGGTGKYGFYVLADAVGSRSASDAALGLDRMRDLGAVIGSTEMAIYEILVKAGTPEFKRCLPFLK